MTQILIAPSLLSADFSKAGEEVESIARAGADWIHLDVMDGHFVPALTFGPSFIKAVRGKTDKVFDTHLMISNPDEYIDQYAEAGSDYITVHAEACVHLDRTLSKIRETGKKSGVAFNPSTPIDALPYVIDKLDLILIMTVNPGFGGQSFLPSMLGKIKTVSEMIGDRDIRLEVDGGISDKTVRQVRDAGADAVVSGSFVFKGDYQKNIDALRLSA